MESQAEYLILNCNKHIKPPFDNKCDSVIHVENFEQFTTVLEDSGDMDFVYLCHIINDNYDNIKPLSKQLFDIIRQYIETNIDTGADEFWNNIAKEGDYVFHRFQKRKFPSSNVRDEKWKLIMDIVNKGSAPKNKVKNYPNRNKTINKYKNSVSDKDKSDTNYNSITVLPITEYFDEFTSNDISIIFDAIYKIGEIGLMVKLWCKLMIQFNTVHLVLTNVNVWNIMNNIMNKPNVRAIMNYSMFYGLFILGREEKLTHKSISIDHRFVFNSTDALNITSVMDNVANNDPWNNIIVGSQCTTSRTVFHLEGTRKLTSNDVFERRLHIATHGAFKNIVLSDYNAILTGSILIPCAAYNPLEKFFIGSSSNNALPSSSELALAPTMTLNRTLTNEEFSNFINYYYPPETEIDNKSDNEAAFINDIDVAIMCDDMESYVKRSTALFNAIKKNIPNAILEEKATPAMLKFKIVATGYRCIDMFPAQDASPVDLVWRFHVSVVKMFWDGNDIYRFNSCITALRLGLCDAYGWISCNKSAADIVLKYAQRGYSTAVNENEELAIVKYMATGTIWNIWPDKKVKLLKIYDKIENIKPDATLRIIGSFNDRHQFFHPNQIGNGIGLRYGMINKVYGKGGKMLVEFDNKVCASRYTTGMSIMSTIVNYRNKIGTNFMVPNIPLIDSVASRLFL